MSSVMFESGLSQMPLLSQGETAKKILLESLKICIFWISQTSKKWWKYTSFQANSGIESLQKQLQKNLIQTVEEPKNVVQYLAGQNEFNLFSKEQKTAWHKGIEFN